MNADLIARAEERSGLHILVQLLSGEWMLAKRPNGGSVILARSLYVAILAYAAALFALGVTDPRMTWVFSARALADAIHGTLPWLAAIFGGIYAAFYARFSSQWTYLAGVYNQIKAVEAQVAASTTAGNAAAVLAQWKAGFIEDAVALHLARKPMMAGIIRAWLPDVAVQKEIMALTPGGRELLQELLTQHGLALPDQLRLPATAGTEATRP